jgi:hypothetical protein
MDTALVRALKQLSWETPILVAYVAGIVVAFANRRRHPVPCLLTASAFAILLATAIGLAFLNPYFIPGRLEHKEEMSSWSSWVLPTAGMAGGFLNAAAYGLLLLAIFRAHSGRSEPGSPVDQPPRPPWTVRLAFGLPALGLYLVALASPAVSVGVSSIGADRVDYRGLGCLIEIPLALIYPAWWANLSFAAGIVCLLRGRLVTSGVFGVIALLLSLSYCLDVLNDFEVRIGYWLWVSSMGILAVSVAFPLLSCRTTIATGRIKEMEPDRKPM